MSMCISACVIHLIVHKIIRLPLTFMFFEPLYFYISQNAVVPAYAITDETNTRACSIPASTSIPLYQDYKTTHNCSSNPHPRVELHAEVEGRLRQVQQGSVEPCEVGLPAHEQRVPSLKP